MADRQIGAALAWELRTGLSAVALVAFDAMAERGQPSLGGAALLAVAVFLLLRNATRMLRSLVERPWLVAASFGVGCAGLALAFDQFTVGGAQPSRLIGPAAFAGVMVALVTRLLGPGCLCGR